MALRAKFRPNGKKQIQHSGFDASVTICNSKISFSDPAITRMFNNIILPNRKRSQCVPLHDEGRPGSGHKNLQNIDSHFQGPRQVRYRRVPFPAGLRKKKSTKNGSNLGRERDEKLDSTS